MAFIQRVLENDENADDANGDDDFEEELPKRKNRSRGRVRKQLFLETHFLFSISFFISMGHGPACKSKYRKNNKCKDSVIIVTML